MNMSRILCIFAGALLIVACLPAGESLAANAILDRADYGFLIEGVKGETAVWWCEAPWKVSRDRALPKALSQAATLSAARDDREAAQVVLRPSKDLKQLTAAVGPLYALPETTSMSSEAKRPHPQPLSQKERGALNPHPQPLSQRERGALNPHPRPLSQKERGAVIPAENIRVFRVYYHPVRTPTDGLGSAGEWPDALPPLDKPLDLAAGKNQPLWVLVHVPRDAKPGEYAGVLKLKAEGWSADVPLRLHVWNFTLPERNHLETAIGLWPEYVFQYHQPKTDADKRRIWDLYMRSFAEHRLSPYDPAPVDPIRVKFLPQADPPRAELDFSAFDAAMDRAVKKYHITNFRLPIEGMGGWEEEGAAPALAGFGEDTPQYKAMFASYVGQIERHLRDKGWLDMAYVYWFDEPKPENYAFVRAGMERLKKYAPGLRTMLTRQPEEGLPGAIDLWCAPLRMYNHAAAELRRAHGEKFWWYVSCTSRAPFCSPFIDHPATDLRVWLWQNWQWNVSGILIWGADYWTSRADFLQNPYEDTMSYVLESRPADKRYYGNGDGRFLYPPPAALEPGAKGPIFAPPISSIRWEMLREGVEDYEYLYLLRDRVARRRASLKPEQLKVYESLLKVPATITIDMKTYTADPRPIYARRELIAQAIERLGK